MDNMAIWSQVDKTDPAITKAVNSRGGFTAIAAQNQLKRATELFGAYGYGWGVRDLVWSFIPNAADPKECALDATFYYCGAGLEEEGLFEISSCMTYKPGNDTRKKLLTDLTTKALSKLGFNSDVFEGKFDDNKYVQERKREEATKTEPTIDHRLSAARKGLGEETFLSVLASEEKSVDELPEMTDEYKLKLLGLMNEARLAKKESSK